MEPETRTRHERTLYARIVVSVALFSLFVIFDVSAVLTRSMSSWAPALLGLLIGAFLIMPREPLPRDWEPGPDPQNNDTYLERMRRIRLWLTYARVAYFLCAIVIFVGLPRLV